MTSFGLAPLLLTMQIMYFPIICGTLGFSKTFLSQESPVASSMGSSPLKGLGKSKNVKVGHQIPPLLPLSQIRKQTQRK